jgi:hypothetical protein
MVEPTPTQQQPIKRPIKLHEGCCRAGATSNAPSTSTAALQLGSGARGGWELQGADCYLREEVDTPGGPQGGTPRRGRGLVLQTAVSSDNDDHDDSGFDSGAVYTALRSQGQSRAHLSQGQHDADAYGHEPQVREQS